MIGGGGSYSRQTRMNMNVVNDFVEVEDGDRGLRDGGGCCGSRCVSVLVGHDDEGYFFKNDWSWVKPCGTSLWKLERMGLSTVSA